MKARILLLAAFVMLPFGVFAQNPKANVHSVIEAGNARFTILTDRMIRMEWSENGAFENRASLAVVNRNLPVPKFKVRRTRDKLTITTKAICLEYSGGEFTPESLKATFIVGDKEVVWTPGMPQNGNLKGTTRTLDGCTGFKQLSKKETELENGILSRDGWAVIDESGRPLFAESDSDWKNLIIENPDPTRKDWYLLAYGHDYKGALGDYTKIAGRIPLPARFTFGYWWSRYWAYTDKQLIEIADDIRKFDIPSDVFIIDMGWHKYFRELWAEGRNDEFGQRKEWTGYSWETNLIPNPDSLLDALHKKGFKTALNLHPASGIRPFEDCYEAFRKDYLSRTKDYDGPKDYIYPKGGYTFKGNEAATGKAGENAPIPFRLEQKEWADAYFNSVLHPLERQGVDFWWIDWQQWMQSKYSPSIGNTFLCNYMFWTDKVRRLTGPESDRPLIYHRWGGLGSHRYQLGFSGDTYETWDVLAFIPYFTATSSNVCYGYWGHDIGGHMQPKGSTKPTDPELYTRWMQSAVFTPIFKTHSTESKYVERKIWEFPTHFEYLRDAIRLRYCLAPYIYTAAREAYDTGVSICCPLYYEYPEEQKAYDSYLEFFFGPDILATAVCRPTDKESGKAPVKMWFPSGNDWYDMAHHTTLKGGSEAELEYSVEENPWYVKAGAVITLSAEGIKNLQEPDNRLRLLIVPGEGEFRTRLYEDDGKSGCYETDFAFTDISKVEKAGKVEIRVGERKGNYAGALYSRQLSFVLEGWTQNPSAVKVNGQNVVFSCKQAEKALSTKAIVVSIDETYASSEYRITIER